MRTSNILIMGWGAYLLGCTPARPPYVDACEAACDRLRELQCEAASSTPEGTTCEGVCEIVERTGYVTTNPRCVAVAPTCDEAERVSAAGCDGG